MVNCRKCGELIPAGKGFCASCGEKVIVAQSLSREIDYEEFRLRKSKYIGSMIMYAGIIFLTIALVLPYAMPNSIENQPGSYENFTKVPQWNEYWLMFMIVAGLITVIGTTWVIDFSWYLNRKMAKDYWDTHKK